MFALQKRVYLMDFERGIREAIRVLLLLSRSTNSILQAGRIFYLILFFLSFLYYGCGGNGEIAEGVRIIFYSVPSARYIGTAEKVELREEGGSLNIKRSRFKWEESLTGEEQLVDHIYERCRSL